MCTLNVTNWFSHQLTEVAYDLFLLQVHSHLENSKFHLHQTQNQQVKQYLTLGSKLASSAGQGHAIPHPHTPGQPLATVPIMRNGHMASVSDSSNPNSPVTLLTMTNHDSEVSRPMENRKCLNVNYDVAEYMELKLKELKMCLVLTGKGWNSIQEFEPQTRSHTDQLKVVIFVDFAILSPSTFCQ